MKRLLVLLALCSAAFAQGGFIPPQTAFRVVNGFTSPIAGATITVCAGNAAGIPCAPVTVSIFADAALSIPLSNPFTADANGNYQFAVALGNTYTVTVTALGFNGYSYQITVPTNVSNGQPVNGAATPGTGFPLRFVYIYGDSGGTQQVGASGAPTTVGSSLAVAPTTTETVGQQWSSSAVGSGSVVAAIGHGQGAGLNGAFNTFGTIARFAIRLKPVTVSNVRMWIGMGDVNGPSDYSNTVYASDAPPRFYCMFRFSFTTDTTWKAICATDATHQTIVDTGVVPTAATSTLFEIIPTAAMTSVAFYINGISVGTITTNLPSASNRPMMAWMADNKNTATSVGATHFWEQMLYSK